VERSQRRKEGGSMSNDELLLMHLEAMVPLRIHDYLEKGGPSDLDFERIQAEYPQYLGSHGDAVLYREKGTSGRAITVLVDGLAVLSFCPGGVTIFGLHFETKMEEKEIAV
jgi:hypothetical protein